MARLARLAMETDGMVASERIFVKARYLEVCRKLYASLHSLKAISDPGHATNCCVGLLPGGGVVKNKDQKHARNIQPHSLVDRESIVGADA